MATNVNPNAPQKFVNNWGNSDSWQKLVQQIRFKNVQSVIVEKSVEKIYYKVKGKRASDLTTLLSMEQKSQSRKKMRQFSGMVTIRDTMNSAVFALKRTRTRRYSRLTLY